MDLEQIEKHLNELFTKPQELGYERHIVFWYDEKEEFVEDIDNIKLHNVKIHKLDHNNFYTKYLLEKEDTKSNYLIYSNKARPTDKDNWLLDILLYSTEFSADKSSVIMNELKIAELSLKPTIEEHLSFFGSKDRMEKFKDLSKDGKAIKTDKDIKGYILMVLCNLKNPDFDGLLRSVLLGGFDTSENKCIKDFEKHGVIDFFWEQISLKFRYNNTNKSVEDFFKCLMMTYVVSNSSLELPMNYDRYTNLEKNNTTIFVNNWMYHKADFEKFRELSKTIQKDINIADIIKEKDIKDYIEVDNFELFDQSILLNIANSLSNGSNNYTGFSKIIEKRKLKHWIDIYETHYQTLFYAIKIFEFKDKYTNGFQFLNMKSLMDLYNKELFFMDFYYRKFYYFYDQTQFSLKNNFMSNLRDSIENIYTNWFLEDLNLGWNNLINNECKVGWEVKGMDSQQNFYEDHVLNTLKSKNVEKIYVIISDAFRFDCGYEFSEILKKEKGIVEFDSLLGTIPSYTKLGMASLLPHKEIKIDDKGRMFVDGIDSSSLDGRNKILQGYNEESIAVKWNDISGLNQQEARDLFKGKNIVYIYHDKIDSTGDNYKTEKDVFNACETGISELKDIVKKITNSWNGVHVMITADHGFLYKRDKLKEYDKVEIEDLERIDNNRRFIINKTKDPITGFRVIDMNYLGIDGMYGHIPLGNGVLKLQGGGSNFVHGGLCLQEISLPLIYFRYQKDLKEDKNTFKKEVGITLNNTNRAITTNSFVLNFIQEQPIKGKLLEGKYKISLWEINKDEKKIISDEKIIVANSESDKIEDRIYKVQLNLKSGSYDKRTNYYLRIIPDNKFNNDEQEPIPFVIDILIQNDFDSFF